MKIQKWMCWVLCLLLIWNPIFCQLLHAEDSAAVETEAQNLADKAEQQKQEMEQAKDDEEIDQEGAQETAKDGDSLKNKGEDYKAEGQELIDQSAKDKEAKDKENLQASDGSDVNSALNESGKEQDKLDKKGKNLEKIGNILKTVGTALVAIGTALQAFPLTAAAGAAMVAAGTIMVTIGGIMIQMGQADQQGAETASTADQGFVGDSSQSDAADNTSTEKDPAVDNDEIFEPETEGTDASTDTDSGERGDITPVGAE